MALLPDRLRSGPIIPVRSNRREDLFSFDGAATCCFMASCVTYDDRDYTSTMYAFDRPVAPFNKEEQEKAYKKSLKSEAKAQDLLRDIIGFDQWQVYRKTNRVVVMGKSDWIIGNVFGNYRPQTPLIGKPDVVRIDGKSRLKKAYYGTSFCVQDESREKIPYTDKVLAFAINCAHDEKAFYKLANSIGEKTFNQIPECALFKMEAK